MSEKRANWFEMLGTFIQFYPKLSAILAFSSMTALGRMMPSNREAARIAGPKPQLVTSAIRTTKRRNTARKTSKRVRPAKRTNGRRKAA